MRSSINAIISLKRDTLENWILYDPILHEGELVVVWINSNEVKLKVGDGERRFLDLPYVTF